MRRSRRTHAGSRFRTAVAGIATIEAGMQSTLCAHASPCAKIRRCYLPIPCHAHARVAGSGRRISLLSHRISGKLLEQKIVLPSLTVIEIEPMASRCAVPSVRSEAPGRPLSVLELWDPLLAVFLLERCDEAFQLLRSTDWRANGWESWARRTLEY
jgi:hypothetical protein